MSYKYATESMIGKTYLTDIPFYDRNWGFKREHNNYDRSYPLWFNTEDDFIKVKRLIPVKVDISELIEEIILSPYTEPYAQAVTRDMIGLYGIAQDKVINSSIKLR